MKITYGFAPRKIVVESERELVTLIAALQVFVQRPSRLVLSEVDATQDEARETAENLLATLQED